MDLTLKVMQAGQERDLTVEEALQSKTYQDAIGGSCMAQREILKMIRIREKAMAARAPVPSTGKLRFETDDPRNADKAMVLLGIAQFHDDGYPKLKLKTWAIEAALKRRRRVSLTAYNLS